MSEATTAEENASVASHPATIGRTAASPDDPRAATAHMRRTR